MNLEIVANFTYCGYNVWFMSITSSYHTHTHTHAHTPYLG